MSNRNNWKEVTYPEKGRFKKLGVADEGELDKVVLEHANGELQILSPQDDLYHQIEPEVSLEEFEMPIRELWESVNGGRYRWKGEEKITVLADYDHARDIFTALYFPEGLYDETAREIGLLDLDENYD